jgi:hypothetical protein
LDLAGFRRIYGGVENLDFDRINRMNRMKKEMNWQNDLTVWCVPFVWLKIRFILSILSPFVRSGFPPARFH